MRFMFAAVLGLMAFAGSDRAQASDRFLWPQTREYAYCAQYGGRGNDATNCGFDTLAQCMATISGIGGMCRGNPAYVDRAEPAAPRRVRKHARKH
jgi:hypothetical protein